jgi:hypothetical protein
MNSKKLLIPIAVFTAWMFACDAFATAPASRTNAVYLTAADL